MIDQKIYITSEEEKSIAETYDLDSIIEQKRDRYATIGKLIYDAMTGEGIHPRDIGAMIGILARGDTNLNERLDSRGISLLGEHANRIRDILGIIVLEDP